MKFIVLKQVSFAVNGQMILDDISCSFEKNQITTIVGPNGGGKTSLIKLMLGIYRPTSGHIWEKKDLKIGYMPQKIHIDPSMPLSVKRFLGDTSLLEPLGVDYLKNKDMSTLSGGEMQRVLLAGALSGAPDVLILDEPAQGLDVTGEQLLYQHILDYQKKTECGVIMVSHDLNFVMKQTTRVLCINKHICCSGHPQHVSKTAGYQSIFGKALYTHHHDHEHDLEGNICHD